MIPRSHRLNKKDCKSGLNIYGYNPKRKEDKDYIAFYEKMLCMINGHRDAEYLPYYPTMFIFKESDFMKQVKIAYLAMKNKVKILPYEHLGKNNMSALVFKNVKGMRSSILFKYISNQNYDKKLLRMFKELLFGFSSSHIKNAFTFSYFYHKYELSKYDWKKVLEKVKELYNKEYKKDKHATLNKAYIKAKKDALEIIEKERNSAAFKKYYAKEKKNIKPYKFNFKDVYDPSRDIFMPILKKEFEKFKKTIK